MSFPRFFVSMSSSSPLSDKSVLSSPFAFKAKRALALFRREVVGFAQDFWKDGGKQNDGREQGLSGVRTQGPNIPFSSGDDPFNIGISQESDRGFWHAVPGEISEKMWGDGFVTPGDDFITDLLIKPLNLTKDMSVLDLAAGLGARMRKATEEFGVYITGREPDPELAARGMSLSVKKGRGKQDAITAYDPMNLVETKKYDCVIARETIYRVSDKKKFIEAIVGCCKHEAQVSFTDYILNPEVKDQPAIIAWRAFEDGAAPLSLVDMAGLWAKAGLSLRVHDDQTDFYKGEIKKGLLRFARFIESGQKPDAETKRAIERRIALWAHRMAALEQGLRFYRFYGLR